MDNQQYRYECLAPESCIPRGLRVRVKGGAVSKHWVGQIGYVQRWLHDDWYLIRLGSVDLNGDPIELALDLGRAEFDRACAVYECEHCGHTKRVAG